MMIHEGVVGAFSFFSFKELTLQEHPRFVGVVLERTHDGLAGAVVGEPLEHFRALRPEARDGAARLGAHDRVVEVIFKHRQIDLLVVSPAL